MFWSEYEAKRCALVVIPNMRGVNLERCELTERPENNKCERAQRSSCLATEHPPLATLRLRIERKPR